MVVTSEPPKRENQENSEILNHGGENCKSSVPVYCLFGFPFMAIFLHLLILCFCPFQSTETGSKDKHSKNKWQNINCLKQQSFMHAVTSFF